MSFVFPKPPLAPTTDFDSGDVDFAELLLRLSIFAFGQLSATDQLDRTEEIREKVVEDVIVEQLPKESDEDFRLRTFTELFNKLPIAEQNLLLSSFIKMFKREWQFGELVSWFKQIGASYQQEMLEKLFPEATPKKLRNPGETVKDFRLRRFTGLAAVYTDYIYNNCLVAWQDYENQWQMAQNPQISNEEEDGNNDEGSEEDTPQASGDDDECSDKERNETSDEDDIEFSDEYTEEASDEDKEEASNEDNVVSMSRFAKFFSGFSIIWFKGQIRANQQRLIGQLCDGLKGVIIQKLPRESKEKFTLRKFEELCKKVVDFRTQVHFLDIAEKRLRKGTSRSLPHGKLLLPQDSASAAELSMRLSTFGFSLLSAADQRQKIKEISDFVYRGVKKIKRLPNESTEDFRVRRFKELFYEDGLSNEMHLTFKEFSEKFFSQRQLHESIPVFRQLSSKDQQDLIEKMFERLLEMDRSLQDTGHQTWATWQFQSPSEIDMKDEEDDADDIQDVEIKYVMIEKFSDESEEDFRLRRFITLCSKHPILWEDLGRAEAMKCDRKDTLHPSNSKEIQEIKECRYADFYFGVSIIWFKARCASIPRNPIQVLFGQVEADRLIQKLPDEIEEDFKLRRFTESFKQLPFNYQEKLVKYIRKTVSHDVGEKDDRPRKQPYIVQETEAMIPELIKVRDPNVRGPLIKTTKGLQGVGKYK